MLRGRLRTSGADALRAWAHRIFHNVPIRQKLLIITGLVTAAALVLAGTGIFVFDEILFRTYLEHDLITLAQITAEDSTAALAFDDPSAASQTLRALKARPHILSACIYRDGSLFASYVREGVNGSCSPEERNVGRRIRGMVATAQPIFLQNQRIGTLALVDDRGEIKERMRVYGVIIIVVLIAASFGASLISSRLRGLIATPIVRLAETASAVSATRDYSIRASQLTGDETGTLVDAFNEMLSGIQSRDYELREALNQLQRSNENLARSNEDLERFAFVASHDLQEPLRMISVYSQLLAVQSVGKLDADAQASIEHVVSGAKRMRELLADLLEYTHLGSPSSNPEALVDLNVTLENALRNLQLSINRSGAVISADPLPTIRANEAHFLPLFQNLIGNAIKYHSDAPPRIHISCTETDERRLFSFADNGIGIAPEYHQKIFVPFKRLHGKAIPGTGIGLAICERIVKRYGGRIWVESNVGQGATFLFTLPKETEQA